MASHADLARQLTYSNPINGTVIMKKDWLHRVGLFNPQLPTLMISIFGSVC